MKTALILAAMFAAFALVGTEDYQLAASMAAKPTPLPVAVLDGDRHVR